ncbi:MAG: phosphogluconate dehydratase, partial [Nevskia sp.]|nr:phosphogluconate dehydratase [Nevskia sp.]
MSLHPILSAVTARIRERSAVTRAAYLQQVDAARRAGSARGQVSCTNLAHAIAAVPDGDKRELQGARWPNLA